MQIFMSSGIQIISILFYWIIIFLLCQNISKRFLPQNIFLKDSNSDYISCNENYAGALGIASADIAGRNDYEFFPKELAEKYRADDKRIMAKGELEDIEESYIHDGEERYIHIIKVPVRNKEGGNNLLGIFWDITEEKQAETKLEDAYKALLEKSENLEKFQKLTVGRELEMIRLKKEVNSLLEEAGATVKYELSSLD